MGSNSVATLFLVLAAVVPSILAVTFQVGDTAGWNSVVDYTTWASGKTFRVGDTLEFQYDPSHSVSVVDKAGFDGCDSTGETQSFSGGDTKINLTTVGTMYFLCPSPGHCLGGMKLAVSVLATAASPTTPSPRPSPRTPRKTPPPTASPPANGTPDSESLTPSPSPSTPSLSTSRSPSASPPNAAPSSKGVINYGVIGMTMVLMYGVMS
ncbi:hypothetical protein CARUB_v10018027mg [Capsella rubella]|uniref:Phytocyanin domain-containing protein n=1 Tax=Capsella rubella TaxID=81985 RepID=R0HHS3_9BRAS|nr:uclacyanin-3 [Capsella rubella]EOA24750.1 hypothetical protein CARUB_v10018027mg [Capsella rubella]